MKHIIHRTLISLIFVAMGCSGNELFLEKRPGYNPEPGVLRACLNMAYEEINVGKSNLTAEEENALGGRDVTKFLWWGSLAGPRPVVNTAGKPSEASSLVTYPSTNSLVSKRYVLCLLRNGYEWPPNQK
jgi:hypothetical protein